MLLPLYSLCFVFLISLSAAASTNSSTPPPLLHSNPPSHAIPNTNTTVLNTTSPLPSLPIPPSFPLTPCPRSNIAPIPHVFPRGSSPPPRSCLLTHVSFHDHHLIFDVTDEFPLLASPPLPPSYSAAFPLLPDSPTPASSPWSFFSSDTPPPTYRYVIALVSSLPVVSVKVFAYHPIPFWQRVAYPVLAMFNAQRLSDWEVEVDFRWMTGPRNDFRMFAPSRSTPRAYCQVQFITEGASGELAVWRERVG